VSKLVAGDGLEAWRSFLQAHAAVISKIERDLDERGLVQLIWYDVLVAIQAAPGHRIRMSALADHLVLTRSGATRLIDRLETAKLVQREPADDDRRGAFATLTAGGRDALRRAWPVYARGINEQFLAHLSKREVEMMASAFSRIRKVSP